MDMYELEIMVKEMMKMAKTNTDGQISYEEFANIMG